MTFLNFQFRIQKSKVLLEKASFRAECHYHLNRAPEAAAASCTSLSADVIILWAPCGLWRECGSLEPIYAATRELSSTFSESLQGCTVWASGKL